MNRADLTRLRWIDVTTLGDLLARRAHEHPDRIALAFPDIEVSYAQLDARADLLARGLLAAGVTSGDTVGILLPNCPDSIAALFAVTRVGARPVPINNRFKEHELAQVVQHSRMRLLFAHSTTPIPATVRQQAGHLRQVVRLGPGDALPEVLGEDEFLAAALELGAASARERSRYVRVRDTAVVMYTSGTSASPKGAMISHEALIRFAIGAADTRLGLDGHDRVWTPLPLFHIGAVAFAIASIYAGCTYCHVGFFRPETALEQLEAQRATVALPGFETIWLPVLDHPDFATRDLSALRLVMTVGVPERVRDMANRLPHAVQVSCFGMTEASSFLSLSEQTDTQEQRTTTGGRPLPGMECRVVDPETGRDLPPGTEGELLFRGTNCFDGYLHDPELTARCFDEQGWFHTGDVAVMDAEGRVTFVSRLKDMLKVGGENVSAVEVEDFLLRHPAVHIVQVVAAPDSYYAEVPAAFIELAPGAVATEQEIIDYCLGSIATYRAPRYVRFVDEWPMSGTKIKKYVLRDRIRAELEEHGIDRAPKLRAPQATR
ncbi:AMP-binding protein [Nocardia zapadnayensis]|uniref:class I adenylate-forming enzyme family protein n=1 Tax=Nocardia rhamnosiphila TaxID=426716 RepID=UPI002245E62E|nr:AMP-binding protein [Nocardia zapadnayensis]MCX0272541.1 AMP-binding protein [Nocardia zapadnayensis]